MTTTPVMVSVPHAANLNQALHIKAYKPTLEAVLGSGTQLPVADDHVFISFVVSPRLSRTPTYLRCHSYDASNAVLMSGSLGEWKLFVTSNLHQSAPKDMADSARAVYEYIKLLPLIQPFKGYSRVSTSPTEYFLERD